MHWGGEAGRQHLHYFVGGGNLGGNALGRGGAPRYCQTCLNPGGLASLFLFRSMQICPSHPHLSV